MHYLSKAFDDFDKNWNKSDFELWLYAYAVFYKEYSDSREKIEERFAKGILEIAKKHGHPDFEKLCEFERLITAPSEK